MTRVSDGDVCGPEAVATSCDGFTAVTCHCRDSEKAYNATSKGCDESVGESTTGLGPTEDVIIEVSVANG